MDTIDIYEEKMDLIGGGFRNGKYDVKNLGSVLIVLGFIMFIVSMTVFAPSGDLIGLVLLILVGAAMGNIGVLIMKKSGAE